MNSNVSRRQWLIGSGMCLGAAGVSVLPGRAAAAGRIHENNEEPFGYCLNTATIMGHKLSLPQEVDLAARAGYQAIEPWIRNIRSFVESGGVLGDVRKRIDDAGLQVLSAIGFPSWAVDDDAQRNKALETFREEMDLVAQLGGRCIAAPPAGINRTPGVDLRRVAERYRLVLELGRQAGVIPQLEIWGSAQTLGRVSEAAFVALEANHPDACLLLDAFHMYRGGSSVESLRLLNGAAMHAFHLNDYPAEPPREQINDSYRVYPGDGVAPLDQLLRTLYQTGFRGMLSLELFNRQYWEQDPLEVARTGLEKMRAAVRRALGAGTS